jgi:hypothetical protein
MCHVLNQPSGEHGNTSGRAALLGEERGSQATGPQAALSQLVFLAAQEMVGGRGYQAA